MKKNAQKKSGAKRGKQLRPENYDARFAALDFFCKGLAPEAIAAELKRQYPDATASSVKRWAKNGKWEKIRAGILLTKEACMAGIVTLDWSILQDLLKQKTKWAEKAKSDEATPQTAYAYQQTMHLIFRVMDRVMAGLGIEGFRQRPVDLVMSALLASPKTAKALAQEMAEHGEKYADALRESGISKAEAEQCAEALRNSIENGIKSTQTLTGLAAVAKKAAERKGLRVVDGGSKRTA